MSRLTEQLREVGVFNDTNFFQKSDDPKTGVFVYWQSETGSRNVMVSRAFVRRLGFLTARREAPWYDHGNKTFSGFEANAQGTVARRRLALEQAMAWASERYGITEWKRAPTGGYGDAEFVTRRLAELKAKIKETTP